MQTTTTEMWLKWIQRWRVFFFGLENMKCTTIEWRRWFCWRRAVRTTQSGDSGRSNCDFLLLCVVWLAVAFGQCARRLESQMRAKCTRRRTTSDFSAVCICKMCVHKREHRIQPCRCQGVARMPKKFRIAFNKRPRKILPNRANESDFSVCIEESNHWPWIQTMLFVRWAMNENTANTHTHKHKLEIIIFSIADFSTGKFNYIRVMKKVEINWQRIISFRFYFSCSEVELCACARHWKVMNVFGTRTGHWKTRKTI